MWWAMQAVACLPACLPAEGGIVRAVERMVSGRGERGGAGVGE